MKTKTKIALGVGYIAIGVFLDWHAFAKQTALLKAMGEPPARPDPMRSNPLFFVANHGITVLSWPIMATLDLVNVATKGLGP